MFRLQKLLINEYPDLYEPIIIETAFAEVDEFGYGKSMQQVATNMYFARDNFNLIDPKNYLWPRVDPEYETLELVSIMPLKCIKINFYTKRRRQIMEIAMRNNEECRKYFELGGNLLYKNLIWNTWQERICTLRLTHANADAFSLGEANKLHLVLKDDESVTDSLIRSARQMNEPRRDLFLADLNGSICSVNDNVFCYALDSLEQGLTH